MQRRDALAALVIALVSGLVFASPATDIAHGLSIDVLTALRWQLFGQREKPEAAPTAVIVLDEESFNIDPFKSSLVSTWTPEIGKVLTAVIDGGAKVVGFDIIFPTLIEQSKIPFDGETLGARLRGFDRDFLRALAIGARAEKVVLGEVLQRERPIGPSPGQRIAVGRDRNIRALNTYSDPDYVVRRLPLAFPADKPRTPSMAVELASRALGAAPEVTADGSATKLAGYRIPSAVPNTVTLNFEGGADAILPIRLPTCMSARKRATRSFSGLISMAKLCSSARCSTPEIAGSHQNALLPGSKARGRRDAHCRRSRRRHNSPAIRSPGSMCMRPGSTI